MGLTLPGLAERQRVQALESLTKRGFLLDQSGEYPLHPPYLRYVLAAWLAIMVGAKILERQGFAGILILFCLRHGLCDSVPSTGHAGCTCDSSG